MTCWKTIEELEIGDVIAEKLVYSGSKQILFDNGQIVTQDLLVLLRKYGIKWVLVSRFCDEDTEKPLNNVNLKKYEKKITEIIKNIEKDQFFDMHEIEKTASSILSEVEKIYGNCISINLLKLKELDDYTYTHQVNVSIVSSLIALEYSGSDIDFAGKIAASALVHDIGKIWISKEILNGTQKMTPDEFELMKQHVRYGYDIALKSKIEDPIILSGILSHHEKWNGGGYTNKIGDEKIPISARIISIADVYDALTSARTYKKSWSAYKSSSYIVQQSKLMFDPKVVMCFLRVIGLFPVGTQVKLSSGELGIVKKVYRNSPATPIVSVIRDEKEKEIDLSLKKDFFISGVVEEKLVE